MMHALEVLAIGGAAIAGWETTRRWLERRKGTNRRASDPADPDAIPEPEEPYLTLSRGRDFS